MIDRSLLRSCVAAVFIVSACASTAPVEPADGRHSEAIKTTRARLGALMKAQEIPGMSVSVAVDGEIVWSEGFGLADVEQNVAAAPATRYRLGSVSKLFTAMIAARLAERGELDLDAPVQKYVPSFPEKQAPVTARQLLGHTAGVRHYRGTDPIFAGKRYGSLLEGLAIFRDDPLLSDPGSAYSYTSYGYNLLGVVLEGAGGKTFADLLAQEVARPLSLESVVLDEPERIIPERAAFYSKGRDGTLVNAGPNDSSYKWPSGGLLGSADDLARFGSALLRPGLLGDGMLAAMFTPQTLAGGTQTNVGLGWRIARDDVRYYHHGGAIDGGRAFILVLPDQRVVVAMLANVLARYDEKDMLPIARRFAGIAAKE